jgi:hypothetical protein
MLCSTRRKRASGSEIGAGAIVVPHLLNITKDRIVRRKIVFGAEGAELGAAMLSDDEDDVVVLLMGAEAVDAGRSRRVIAFKTPFQSLWAILLPETCGPWRNLA